LIRSLGIKAGISIKPSTPTSSIKDLLPLVDLVLIMTVKPGFGGQKLIPECLDKIPELCQMRQQSGQHFLIQVDGGVQLDNHAAIKDLGADVLVAGSAIFNAKDPSSVVHQMLESGRQQ
jgi:ribulose-phosphate 3-epimerase